MKNRLAFLLLFFLSAGAINAQQTVGLFVNTAQSLNGYTLIAPLNSNKTHLIDNCGRLVNEWKASTYYPGASVDLLPDGSLLRTCKLTTGTIIAGGSGGRIERYDWNDSLIWEYNVDSPTERQHHDVRLLPNGNLLVLAWDIKTKAQAVLNGLDTSHYNGTIWSEKLIELQPIGSDSAKIVWEWYLWDHMVQDYNINLPNYDTISQNPQLVDINYANNNGISPDYFHANGLDYNPHLDQIIICVRNYDEFWIIDHSTTTAEAASNTGGLAGKGGDLLYRWGNPEAYGRGTINDKTLFGMHNPNWIPTGYRDGGKIMVFNNGYNKPIQESLVEIINPPLLSNNNYLIGQTTSFGPAATSWSYTMPAFVDFVSGARRLENGNTFICSGPDGHIYELDSMNMVVWEYINPVGNNGVPVSQGNPVSNNTMYRAERYAENFSAFTNKVLTPRDRLELNPYPFNCTIYSSAVGIEEIHGDSEFISLIQNPIKDELLLKSNTTEPTLLRVFDLNGRLLLEQRYTSNNILVNAETWAKQMLLVIAIQGNKVEKFKVVKQ